MKRSKEEYQKLIASTRISLEDTFEVKSKIDRGKICKIDWDRNDEFYVLTEIESALDFVCGYASTIEYKGTVDNVLDVEEKLANFNIFKNARFLEWWLNNKEQYPNLTTATQLIDSLRLLIIEYLSLYKDKA